MTVRWRRSPSTSGRPGSSNRARGDNSEAGRFAETSAAGVAEIASELPHWVQNLAPDLLVDPQFEHFRSRGAAQRSQKFAPSRLFEPQFAQRIATLSVNILVIHSRRLAAKAKKIIRRIIEHRKRLDYVLKPPMRRITCSRKLYRARNVAGFSRCSNGGPRRKLRRLGLSEPADFFPPRPVGAH